MNKTEKGDVGFPTKYKNLGKTRQARIPEVIYPSMIKIMEILDKKAGKDGMVEMNKTIEMFILWNE